MTEASGPPWADLWKNGALLISDSLSVGKPIPSAKANIRALGS